MTETIDYVREDHIQDERTAGMFDAVNQNCKQKTENDERMRREWQDRIRELEVEKAARRERFWILVHTAVGAFVILASLAYMYCIGAMHGALAVGLALLTAFGAGKVTGESGLFTREG